MHDQTKCTAAANLYFWLWVGTFRVQIIIKGLNNGKSVMNDNAALLFL